MANHSLAQKIQQKKSIIFRIGMIFSLLGPHRFTGVAWHSAEADSAPFGGNVKPSVAPLRHRVLSNSQPASHPATTIKSIVNQRQFSPFLLYFGYFGKVNSVFSWNFWGYSWLLHASALFFYLFLFIFGCFICYFMAIESGCHWSGVSRVSMAVIFRFLIPFHLIRLRYRYVIYISITKNNKICNKTKDLGKKLEMYKWGFWLKGLYLTENFTL